MSADGTTVKISPRWSATVWTSYGPSCTWVVWWHGDVEIEPLDLPVTEWEQDLRDYMQDAPPANMLRGEALVEAVEDRLMRET